VSKLARLPQFKQLRDFFDGPLKAVARGNKRAAFCFHHGVAAACLHHCEKPM